MAGYRTERTFAGKTSQEIFEATRKTIDDLAHRYSLKHEPEAARLRGKVSRMGTEGIYQVVGEKLTLDLAFSFVIPGAVRRRVETEVNERLDALFS